MQTTLRNEKIEIQIHAVGAELQAMKSLTTGKDYFWYGDPEFWGRRSPVLFPFVGSVKDKKYRHEGVEYAMNQHGFARDMEFTIISQNETEIWYAVDSTEETFEKYPYHFHMEIGYRLEGNVVRVMWKVKNTNDKTMYFSIGAHPAFLCPFHKEQCYLGFTGKDGKTPEKLVSRLLGDGGCVIKDFEDYPLEDGLLPFTETLFDCDTLIMEDDQIKRVALLDKDKKEYLAVEFDAPLVGVWSPPGKPAPFVCIEPWYGRCDGVYFDGELKDREWGNTLEAGQEFCAEYKICLFD